MVCRPLGCTKGQGYLYLSAEMSLHRLWASMPSQGTTIFWFIGKEKGRQMFEKSKPGGLGSSLSWFQEKD